MVYPIFKIVLYPFCWIFIRNINGVENIPNRTPFIIVSNHEKLIDPLYIIYPTLRKLNKKVHFLASTKWWFLGETICRQWAGCIPLFDKKQAFEESKALVKSEEIVGIFPEGGTRRTRNPKTGAIRFALETKVPILPIGLKSSYIPFKSTMSIGELVYMTKNKGSIKKQSAELMQKVYRLRNAL